MSLKPKGLPFPDRQEHGRGRIAEIRSIIKNVFVNVVEDGWRGPGIDAQTIPNFKIARVPSNPNVKRGEDFSDFPNYPVYVVCPADFPTVEYSYDGSRTVFDYSESLQSSPYVHRGLSTAFKPERKDYDNASQNGEFDGFTAPWFSNNDGSGSSGQGYVALVNRNGEVVTGTRVKVRPEYAVVFLGMDGNRHNKTANYHGFAVVKE